MFGFGWPEPEYGLSRGPVGLVSSCHGLSFDGWEAMVLSCEIGLGLESEAGCVGLYGAVFEGRSEFQVAAVNG